MGLNEIPVSSNVQANVNGTCPSKSINDNDNGSSKPLPHNQNKKPTPKADPLTLPEMCVSGKTKNNPSINDYYKAASMVMSKNGDKKPIQYQHGLSNYSSVQLGDDRVSITKSLSQDVFRLDTERAEQMASQLCPNVKKTYEKRKDEYSEAINEVGFDEIHKMEQMMRDKLQQRTKTGPFQLRKTFKYFDRDGSGSIDFLEFEHAMELMGFQFTEIQQLALFARYDENCTGEVNYNEFVEKLMDTDYRASNLKEGKTSLAKMASKCFGGKHFNELIQVHPEEDSDMDDEERERFRRTEIKKLFEEVDTDHNQAIDKREVHLLLGELGMKHDNESVEKGFNEIDLDSSGLIDFEEFYKWYNRACNALE